MKKIVPSGLVVAFLLLVFTSVQAGIEVPQSVPEPSSLILFGTGLLGLIGLSIGRRKK